MNNRAGIGAVLVVSLICVAVTGFGQTGGGKVEIKDDYIVVHPGAKISKTDSQALDAVLGKYDKSLYKIDIYKKGQTTNTLGNLRDMCIDQRAVAELMQAKAQGESNRAIQLVAPGTSVNPTKTTNESPTPGTSVNPTSSTNGSPPGAAVPVHPTIVPSEPQAPTPTGPQAAINAEVAVNPTGSNHPCASTDPKASEFLQRVKPILEKYSR